MATKQSKSARDIIMAICDTKYVMFNVPEWEGIKLCAKSVSQKERASLVEKCTHNGGEVDNDAFGMALVMATICDPKTKELVFIDGDRSWLEDKNPEALERLGTAAGEANGLSSNSIEDAEKN